MKPQPILAMEGISKRFGPTRALHNVSLSVQAGEVLALVGENGAGKSTLLKTLSGAHQPDRGSMTIAGDAYRPSGPHDARAAGVAMIYQELTIAPDLSIEDNVQLGRAGTGWGTLFRGMQRARVQEALETVGLGDLSPTELARDQSVATQQLIEIARALVGQARVILFDEPTSSLPQHDVERLFQIIARLKATGIGIVYISHFLEEVRCVADRFTVLRDGENAGDGLIGDYSDEQIISLMVGRDLDHLFPTVPHTPGKELLEIANLSGEITPRRVNVKLREGEIFGIAGLVGAGRTELLRCLFALDYVIDGDVLVRNVPVGNSVRQRMQAGFGMLSEDRKSEGLAQNLSIIENISLSNLTPYRTFGILNLAERDWVASDLMRRLEVKAHSGQQQITELSGGNQQKVAIARVLHQQADILLMDEPTKGIDVGTKAEIYRLMGELAVQGKTIVFVSSYLPELMAVCDRIGVMAKGQLRAVRAAADWTEEEVMQCAIEIDERV